jgi:hypothetical protein
MLALTGLQNHHREASRANYTAAQEHNEAEWIVPFGSASEGQYTDPKAYREEWRNERDLEAQQDMARWAWWLLICTAIGVALLLVTFWETRKAANAALVAADATKDAVSAQSNAERAYVFLDFPFTTDLMAEPGYVNVSVTFRLKNFGRTAAIMTDIGLGIGYVPDLEPGNLRLSIRGGQLAAGTVLGAGEKTTDFPQVLRMTKSDHDHAQGGRAL